MAITTVVVDWRPSYLESDGAATSLLLSPLGAGTLLNNVHEGLKSVDAHALAVIPNFRHGDAYRRALDDIVRDAKVIPATRFGEWLESFELSDRLLLVDARYWPVSDLQVQRLLCAARHCPLVKHLVHLRRNVAGMQERVVYDQRHRVRAIQRLYDGVTQFDVDAVSASVLSVVAARHLASPNPLCPANVRTRLAEFGLPTHDVTADGPVLDLMDEDALLAANERVTEECASGEVCPPFEEVGARVRAGGSCDIHPTCRIYGPVILHDHVTIEAGAVLIGPAVLGAGSRVGSSAVVSRCLVGPNALVADGACVVDRVLPAGTNGVPQPQSADESRWRLGAGPRWERKGYGYDGWQQATHSANGRSIYPSVKRVLDLFAALIGLIALSPLLAVAALLVKLTSRGPVFFAHDREGRDGKVFCCWKFRTMVDRAHGQQRDLYQKNALDGPQFDLPDDPRITWLGRKLRTTNIDELPQLYNVLRGDMSLIGPRPSPFRENQFCVSWRKARLSVRPGITGLWQVCRHDRRAGDFHQWIYFDTLYVRHMSPWLDLRILLATFLTLAGRWSVPLSWMIPTGKVSRRMEPSEQGRAPAAGGVAKPGSEEQSSPIATAAS